MEDKGTGDPLGLEYPSALGINPAFLPQSAQMANGMVSQCHRTPLEQFDPGQPLIGKGEVNPLFPIPLVRAADITAFTRV